jgi:hypothetical protein
VESATANLQPSSFILRAGRLGKKGGPRYSVRDGLFTTCECGGLERPSWSLGGAQTDVTLQGAGIVRGLTFRVKDVPVLWLPYFVFPANTRRQSGFLIPRVGYSNRRGFQYEQPFYWAIDKSSDATVALDVETEARIGVIGEYRYRLSRAARGGFVAAYYNEEIRGRSQGTVSTGGAPADVPENRFAFAGHHFQPAYGKSNFYLDLFAVSDDLFLREINNFASTSNQGLTLRSTRFTTSRTGLFKSWGEGLAWGETAYYQDLIDPQDLALQKLPRLEAEHSMPLLGNRLVGRVAGEAVNYQREDGFDGLRGDLAPELFLPFRLGRGLRGSVTGRVRETAYHLTDREQVAFVVPDPGIVPPADSDQFRVAPELPRLGVNRSRELAEVHARTATSVERVFDFPHLGLGKLKHTIEPELQYLFVPQVGRPIFDVPLRRCDTLPLRARRPGDNCDATLFSEGYLFDEVDAINRRNFLSYGLTTRLLGRAPTAAELASRPAAAAETMGAAEALERQPIDPDVLVPGVSADALPDFVGPPAPPSPEGPAPPPRELLRASVLHGYDISRPLVGDSHWSDVDLGLRFTPLDYLGLTYNTTVSLEDSTVRGMAVGMVVREPWWTPTRLARYQGATTLGLAYRFVEENVNNLEPGTPESLLLASSGVNEIAGSVYLRLGNYLGFTFMSRYTLNDSVVASDVPGQTEILGPHFLERDYLLRLISRCNCWILEAGVSDTVNPDERQFRVQLTLVGLGSFGQRPAGGGYVGFAPLANLGLRRFPGPRAGGLY